MNLKAILIFLLIILLSACAVLASRPVLNSLVDGLVTWADARVEILPERSPTPTAMPLPTRIVEFERPRRGNQAPTPETLLDQFLPEREIVAESEHLIVYAQDGYFPVDQDWFLDQAETVYDYVSQRLDGAGVTHKVELGFLPPDERACPVRGLASHSDTPMVLIYADEQSPRAYILGVLAHELGHAIPADGFANGLPDHQALTEGLATWASGKYWAGWIGEAGLEDIVRGYIARGEYEPLYDNVDFTGMYPWHDDAGSDCLDRRDKIYAEWGVFVGYLIDTYGWDNAYQLFQAPEPVRRGEIEVQFPPDFEGIYGRSLNQLEHEWLQSLTQAGRNPNRSPV